MVKEPVLYAVFRCFRKWCGPTWDVGKTMSYVGKMMSDVNQTTSDLFFAACKRLKNKALQTVLVLRQFFEIQGVA